MNSYQLSVISYQYIRDLRQVWYTALPTWHVINRAENLMNHFSLSHWDAKPFLPLMSGSRIIGVDVLGCFQPGLKDLLLFYARLYGNNNDGLDFRFWILKEAHRDGYYQFKSFI